MSRKIKHNLRISHDNFSVRNKEVLSIKKKITACVLLLVLMALLPFSAAKCSDGFENSTKTVTSSSNSSKIDNKNNSDSSDNVLNGLTAAVCKNSYCNETIKAIAILINTDYSVSQEKFDLNNKSVYLSENDLDNSDKEYYSRIIDIVNSAKEITLTVDNKKVYIPYFKNSCGYTLDSKENEYIISVASPWDCFSESYDKNAECTGVSLDGVEYLCRNGASAEEALKWYLPNFMTTSHN